MIPERAGVGQREAILERLSRRDGTLHDLRAVHGRRQTESMPMNRRRFRQAVREANDDRVSDAPLDRGTRNLPVVRPAAKRTPGSDLPIGHVDVLLGLALLRLAVAELQHPVEDVDVDRRLPGLGKAR